MAALLNNLALLYQAQGDYKEALLLYQRILQVEKKRWQRPSQRSDHAQ